MIAAKVIDGGALVQLVWVGLVATLVVVGAFSLAILGAARATTERRLRRAGPATLYALLTALSVAVCLAAVGAGVAAMLHKG